VAQPGDALRDFVDHEYELGTLDVAEGVEKRPNDVGCDHCAIGPRRGPVRTVGDVGEPVDRSRAFHGDIVALAINRVRRSTTASSEPSTYRIQSVRVRVCMPDLHRRSDSVRVPGDRGHSGWSDQGRTPSNPRPDGLSTRP
jgi:hypothetical protein